MMTREQVRARLYFQGLYGPSFETPADMVRYFGAVQAQDFFGSLWAVGQRVIDATEASVEAALNNGSLVRSWPMRGTIHYTAPEDLPWMLDLLADRAIAKSAAVHRDVKLTKKDFVKCRAIFEREMQGGKIVERKDIYEMLEKNRVRTANSRGLHIIGQMAREKVICFGPRKGKQPTFVLLDEWIRKRRDLSKDDALAELTLRYFISHGPATARDFAWWSGITITEALRGLDMVNWNLKKSGDYWMNPDEPFIDQKLIVRLLPAYDEFLVAYKDRDDMRSIFTSTVVVNGDVVGTWKRTLTKGVSIKTKLFDKLSQKTDAAVQKEMKRYADFIGYIRL
jgi:hypothetical protein